MRKPVQKEVSTRERVRLKIFANFSLQLLKTLLEQSLLDFWFGSSRLVFEQVPLGRFYSSRPSSRSRGFIVSE